MNLIDTLHSDATRALTGKLQPAALWVHETVPDGGRPLIVGKTRVKCRLPLRWRKSVGALIFGAIPTPAIELLAASLAPEPKQLDKIAIDGGWWIVKEIALDAAGVMWTCQCAATGAAA